MDPVKYITRPMARMVYQMTYVAALALPGTKRQKAARARLLAAKAEANAQKNTPAAIAVGLNIFVLGLLGTSRLRDENEKDGDTIEAVMDNEGFFVRTMPTELPASGNGGSIPTDAAKLGQNLTVLAPSVSTTMDVSAITTQAPSAFSMAVATPGLQRTNKAETSGSEAGSETGSATGSVAGTGQDIGYNKGDGKFPTLQELRGNGYGSGTGKKYGPQRDKFKDQKILFLYPKPNLDAYKSIQAGSNQKKAKLSDDIINLIKSQNNVTIHDSNVSLATFALPGDRDYTVSGVFTSDQGIRIGKQVCAEVASIAITLKEELENPTHDVIIVMNYTRWQGNRYSDNAIEETEMFAKYLRKSGIRLYFVKVDDMPYSAEPEATQKAIFETGGGYYSAEAFLKLIKANQNSRL